MRKAKKITKEELAKQIASIYNESFPSLDMITVEDVYKGHIEDDIFYIDQIQKDLSKVSFSKENHFFARLQHPDDIPAPIDSLMGLQTLGDLTFLGGYAGGDWETPVFFILYWSGKKIRAYIPDKGNTWNKKTKKAFGNADDDPDDADFDEKLMAQDIQNRILVSP